MASLNISLTFSSDNGDAELFQGSGSGVSNGNYDASEGNPAGSVRFDISASTTATRVRYTWWSGAKETFEDWGVPAGATITGISNAAADLKHSETGSANTSHQHMLAIECDFQNAVELMDASPTTGNQAWHALPIDATDSSMFPLASTDYFGVVAYVDGCTGADGDADVYFDNISFTINYSQNIDVDMDGSTTQTKQTVSGTMTITPPDCWLIGGTTQTKQTVSGTLTFPDVFLHEGPTQTKQTVSGTLTLPDVFLHEGPTQTKQTPTGTLTFVDPIDVRLIQRTYIQGKHIVVGGLSVDYHWMNGAVTQRKQVVDGVVYLPLTNFAGDLITASLRYELLLDGATYPLIRAVVEKAETYQKSVATVPAAVMPMILSANPTAMVINVYRTTVDGAGVDMVQLFSGTVDSTLFRISPLVGAIYASTTPSYASAANRPVDGRLLYTRDTGRQAAVRADIDPSTVPGDVILYGGSRELLGRKVIFNIDDKYSFMEVSNGL